MESLKGTSAKLSCLDDVKLCPNPDCATPTTKISGCMCVDESAEPRPFFCAHVSAFIRLNGEGKNPYTDALICSAKN